MAENSPFMAAQLPAGTDCDPYLAWALSSQFQDFVGPGKPSPSAFLVAFELGFQAVQTTESVQTSFDAAFSGWPKPPTLHALWFCQKSLCAFGIATVDMAALWILFHLPGFRRLEVSLILVDPRANWTAAPIEHGRNMPTATSLSTSPVLLGLVDSGCPFAHPALRTYSGGTRVISYWDQGSPSRLANQYGRYLDAGQLKAFMDEAAQSAGGLDEAACYALAEMPELARRSSHGAQLMGHLSSAQPSWSFLGMTDASVTWDDTATSSDIAFVQLPAAYAQGAPRSSFTPQRLLGIWHILQSAGDKTSNIVIPLSSQTFDGPHDGSSLFETATAALVEHAKTLTKTLSILVASGNSAAVHPRRHWGSCHRAMGEMQPNQRLQLPVRVLPCNEQPTFVELWLPEEADDIRLTITPPAASPIPSIGPGVHGWPSLSDPQCAVVFQAKAAGITKSRCILIRISPTLSQAGGATAPCGDWDIGLQSAKGAGPVWAYIRRSEHSMNGVRRSYQSYFPIPDIPEATDLPRERVKDAAGSINGLACGEETTVIGGYRISDKTWVPYAGKGPARGGGKNKSDAAQSAWPAEESAALSGLRGWGNLSGSTVRLGGTSMANALAARAEAGAFKGGTPLPISLEVKLP